jgi:hypothetical protein
VFRRGSALPSPPLAVGRGAFPVQGQRRRRLVSHIVTATGRWRRLGSARPGDGTFAEDQRFAIGRSPYAIVLSDVDRNGALDLVAATGADDEIVVRLRSGPAAPLS